MFDSWMATRIKVLDSHIAMLKAEAAQNPHRTFQFVWEEDVPPFWTRPAYRAAILTHARRNGVVVTDDKEGFSISLTKR